MHADLSVHMYNMHMLGEIILQVTRNVHILIQETFTYMIMDAEHHETNHTITIKLLHEDSDIHITYIYIQKKKENRHRRIWFWN